jgi:hypothetical protein
MLRPLIAACILCGCLTPAAAAQDREFAFGAGYGHLFWEGANAGALEEQGGLRLNGWVSWPITPSGPGPDRKPEPRLGLGLGIGIYYSEHGGDIFEGDNVIIIEPDDYASLLTLEPEVQFSVRFPIGRDYYLEPGIAGTFIVGNYTRGEEVWGFVDEDLDRWRVGGGGRLLLRGAYRRETWSVGLEGSYSYGWLDFDDDIGGEIQQGYLGVFYAHRF